MMVAKDQPRLLSEGRSFRQHRGVSVQTVHLLRIRLRSFHKQRTSEAPCSKVAASAGEPR